MGAKIDQFWNEFKKIRTIPDGQEKMIMEAFYGGALAVKIMAKNGRSLDTIDDELKEWHKCNISLST